MNGQSQHLDAIQDIRRMMQRSSRFISLSGLGGIAAGLWALAGAFFAYKWISDYYNRFEEQGYSGYAFHQLKINLFILACIVLLVSLLSAFYFTWRRAGKNNLPVWDHTTKMMVVNMAIPLVSGGCLVLAMLQHNEWRYIAPCCLLFYGLALVNGSKYTLSDIRYLGILEVILGLTCTQFTGYALYFWAFGFGVLHIIYGFIMWWKNERSPQTIEKNS